MTVPFRSGVMQLTMEPLDEMLASARAMDEAGMDTIWLAEAYPWWRKHGMEARSSTVVSRRTSAVKSTTLTVGVGTRRLKPSNLPFRSGMTRASALAAPVVVGMMFWPAERARRGSLWATSRIRWSFV